MIRRQKSAFLDIPLIVLSFGYTIDCIIIIISSIQYEIIIVIFKKIPLEDKLSFIFRMNV